MEFARRLLRWHTGVKRPMPWKARTDAYAIWLSEIILQQTRLAQGLPYYERFIHAFPTVHALARADEQAVLRLWQGLGYYTRARNLHETAKYVSERLEGRFPDSYAGLLRLKGIGPYTAAAIASFAYNLPHAVVDGNVFRVLARYTGDATDIATGRGKRHFTELANRLLDKERPAAYNQAIMDFGALVCKPAVPLCDHCPLQADCVAYHTGRIATLPVKSKRTARRLRHFQYLVFRDGNYFFIRKRTGDDIWKGLYEFPCLDTGDALPEHRVRARVRAWIGTPPVLVAGPYRQQLTHQTIVATFWEVAAPPPPELELIKVARRRLDAYPFPKVILNYLARNIL